MDPAADRSEWQRRLTADISLLQQNDISPQALVLRLQEVLDGVRLTDWREFRGGGRGLSYQGTEGDTHWICLEFRKAADGVAFYEILKTHEPSFQAITRFKLTERDTKATVSLYIPRFKPPAK